MNRPVPIRSQMVLVPYVPVTVVPVRLAGDRHPGAVGDRADRGVAGAGAGADGQRRAGGVHRAVAGSREEHPLSLV